MHASTLPMLFENESEWPYTGKGTCFIVSNSKNWYLVTAKHVIDKFNETAETVRVYPNSDSRMSIPFDEEYRISGNGDEDFRDLYVLRVSMDEFINTGDQVIESQDIEKGCQCATDLHEDDILEVIGYPTSDRVLDYEEGKIKYKYTNLKAKYIGKSIEEHCHELRFLDEKLPESLDGISGGPVFFNKQYSYGGLPVVIPLLAGIFIRGTSPSRAGHFIDVNVLLNLIHKAENNNA